ncbi:aldehyde dehydrogenase family protein [Microbacterium sp. 179-I 1D1 NHS]|uniref:aldehyde dehydrogenase family protein n=1 Tax=Microbacterium sp. 179-I 1D1 NHS TaxID=3374298 RepID=UPI003879EA36
MEHHGEGAAVGGGGDLGRPAGGARHEPHPTPRRGPRGDAAGAAPESRADAASASDDATSATAGVGAAPTLESGRRRARETEHHRAHTLHPLDHRGAPVAGSGEEISAVAAFDGSPLEPAYRATSPEEFERAASAAADAFDAYRATDHETRAAFLERIADAIEARGAEITERGAVETGLPAARLENERGRTTGQLRPLRQLRRNFSSSIRARTTR